MSEGTDYAQQTQAINVIDDIIISEERRIICYSQTIYDDFDLEGNEYIGLSLGVVDNILTTVVTQTEQMYDQASILILDNDAREWKCGHIALYSILESYRT